MFIIGHLRGKSRPEVFPIGTSDAEPTASRHKAGSGIENALRAKSGGPDIEQTWVAEVGTINQRQFNHTRDMALTIDGNYWKGHDNHGQRPVVMLKGPDRREDGSGQPVIVQAARGFNKGGEHEISPTLGSNAWQQNNHLVKDMRIRRLTPIECERLQGFPEAHLG